MVGFAFNHFREERVMKKSLSGGKSNEKIFYNPGSMHATNIL